MDGSSSANKKEKELDLLDLVAARVAPKPKQRQDGNSLDSPLAMGVRMRQDSQNEHGSGEEEKAEETHDHSSSSGNGDLFIMKLVEERQRQYVESNRLPPPPMVEEETTFGEASATDVVQSTVIDATTHSTPPCNHQTLPGAYAAAPGLEAQRLALPTTTLPREANLEQRAQRPGAIAVSTNWEHEGDEVVADYPPAMDDNNHDDGSGELAIANPVEDSHEALPRAMPHVSGNTVMTGNGPQQRLRPRHHEDKFQQFFPCILVGATVLVASIVIGVVLLVKGTPPPDDASSMPTLPEPLHSKSPVLLEEYMESVFPSDTIRDIKDNPGSPQYRAFVWLLVDVGDRMLHLDGDDDDNYNDRINTRFILATLYYATNGEQWADNTHWLDHTVHHCEWFTTKDYAAKQEFIKIYPSYMKGIYEPLPMAPCNEHGQWEHLWLEENNLQGSLPKEIYLLTSLKSISLAWNYGLGGTVSTRIAQLTDLESYFMSSVHMIGTIPSEIGSLTNLHMLVFSINDLHGTIPQELWQLTNLDTLTFDGNQQLTGTIATEIGLLSKLRWLVADMSSFSGSIPTEVGQIEAFELIFVTGNQLSSTIPSEMGLLRNMQYIQLYDNNLHGTLPTELGLLSAASLLSLHENQLTGQVVSELGLLTNLEVSLNLNNNHLLTGTIPTELGRLSKLLDLDFSNTQISGPIPSEIAQLTSAGHLGLANTGLLSGTIPAELAALNGSLYAFKLEGNPLLSGTIPSSLCQINATCIGSTWQSICEEAYHGLSFDCNGSLLCGCACDEC